jgi:hypothetical protein
MIKVYTASRMSSGNSVFPAKIELSESTVTMRIPGFFSGEEKTIPYSQISSVSIDCPFIGYSSIKIETTGEGEIYAHGFLNEEVEEIKNYILERIS